MGNPFRYNLTNDIFNIYTPQVYALNYTLKKNKKQKTVLDFIAQGQIVQWNNDTKYVKNKVNKIYYNMVSYENVDIRLGCATRLHQERLKLKDWKAKIVNIFGELKPEGLNRIANIIHFVF